jgi:hypothetical protein
MLNNCSANFFKFWQNKILSLVYAELKQNIIKFLKSCHFTKETCSKYKYNSRRYLLFLYQTFSVGLLMNISLNTLKKKSLWFYDVQQQQCDWAVTVVTRHKGQYICNISNVGLQLCTRFQSFNSTTSAYARIMSWIFLSVLMQGKLKPKTEWHVKVACKKETCTVRLYWQPVIRRSRGNLH